MHLGDTPNNLTESDFENLARRTEGFSGSDISVCVSVGSNGMLYYALDSWVAVFFSKNISINFARKHFVFVYTFLLCFLLY